VCKATKWACNGSVFFIWIRTGLIPVSILPWPHYSEILYLWFKV
jgi:hypothetical protein